MLGNLDGFRRHAAMKVYAFAGCGISATGTYKPAPCTLFELSANRTFR
jgi:hypothetical protein